MLAILLAALFAGCQRKEVEALRTIHLRGETMGTYYSVTCLLPSGVDQANLQGEIRDLFTKVDRELSNWNPDSWVSRFNRMGKGEEVPCPPHAFEVLNLSMELAYRTNGALDPTVAPLVALWGFGESPGSRRVPEEAEIGETLELCGYQYLDLDPDKLAVSKQLDGVQLNLSAVAKGYTVDLVADLLTQSGIGNHLVNIGGEVRAKGTKVDHTPWMIGVAGTRSSEEAITERIPMTSGAVATSGDSQRYFEHRGRRFSHIIDPRTGRPVESQLRSVSIMAPSCALADGLATACFVLGPEEGAKLLEGYPQTEGLFLLSDDVVISTVGWAK
jgi:thiamine biosynthesis lipoprotein